MTSPLKLGQLLHDRYLIQQDLGQGRLSRHYLANDTHRFDEPCLVKVFAPDPGRSLTVENALPLFQHQARTLYGLDHPQIANFREFFPLASPERPQFYLVQDFVEGQTYQDLLNLRRGKGFTEREVKQLFRQVLPVLSYLHGQGVFQGQLAPTKIVRREMDGLPMLVDCGDAPTDDVALANGAAMPFVPGPEQDLFYLGVSGLTLLSGQTPTVTTPSRPAWQAELDPLPLSQEFRGFLLNLLTCPLPTGFTSAAAVLTALEKLPANGVIRSVEPTPKSAQPLDTALPEPLFADNETDQVNDQVTAPEALSSLQSDLLAKVTNIAQRSTLIAESLITQATVVFSQLPSPKSMFKSKRAAGFLKKVLLLLGLMAIASGVGWGTGKLWLNWRAQADLKAVQDAPPPPKTPLELKNEIRTRRLNLGLSPQVFQGLANDWLAFKLNQPPADPTAPSLGTEEEQLETAIALLTTLETLSPEALNFLEKNPPSASPRRSPQGDRRRWIPQVNQLRLSSRTFNDLANARFRHYFPDLNPDEIGDRPLDRLWNALALDSLISLEDGSRYQRVSLANEISLNLSGQFDPGQGYAYAINIPQGQFLDLKLEAPPTARLSFYSPSGQQRILENSPNHQWSGPLSETGYYELVITAQSAEPVSFQLQIQIR